MDYAEVGRSPVLVVHGPGADTEVIAHTLSVLKHYGIPFTELAWPDFASFIATGSLLHKVVIFETGIAYSDEHLRLPDHVITPVIRVITDPAPPPGQLLKETAFAAFAGFGIAGAINAGLLAARMLALNDAAVRDRLAENPYPTQ